MLNEVTAASVDIKFCHKLISADFEKKIMTFQNTVDGKDVRVAFDLCVGADGCYSTVRRQLMRMTRWVLSHFIKKEPLFEFQA